MGVVKQEVPPPCKKTLLSCQCILLFLELFWVGLPLGLSPRCLPSARLLVEWKQTPPALKQLQQATPTVPLHRHPIIPTLLGRTALLPSLATPLDITLKESPRQTTTHTILTISRSITQRNPISMAPLQRGLAISTHTWLL